MSGPIRKKVEMMRDALEMTFPLVSRLPRIVKPNPSSIEDLPPNVKKIAEKFRRSLAKALGVKPEEIREDYLVRWIEGWLSAILTPEAQERLKVWWME